MIRKATAKDIDGIVEIYNEIFDIEEAGQVYTNWKRGLYPTKKSAEKALEAGSLYVGEGADGRLYGCVNLNHIQPEEYKRINWKINFPDNEILVIHTLCISPKCKGRGYGRDFIRYIENIARETGCKAIRLDTYEGNFPAQRLYSGMGYKKRGETLFLFEGVIWETLVCMEKGL